MNNISNFFSNDKSLLKNFFPAVSLLLLIDSGDGARYTLFNS